MTNYKCERGAVMVTSIFMVLFLVAMLYIVIGLGRTLVMKEGMQDAADAAAYSSAIFNARGMNLIAFINLVMAALISVLIVLRVAQSLLVVLAGILGGMAVGSFGAAAPLAAQATYQAYQMGKYFKRVKKVVFPILEGLHTTQEAVSVVVPWVAMTSGMNEAARHHEPADGAFAVPGSITLPVAADDFSVLCTEGGRFVADLVFAPFPDALDPVLDLVSDKVAEISGKTSKFLCGDGSSGVPTQEYDVLYERPEHPDQRDCGEEGSAKCRQMIEELEAAKPDESDGSCRRDCRYDDPYETRARDARLACEPMLGPKMLEQFAWQERTVEVDYTFMGDRWVEQSRRTIEWRFVDESKDPPCGHGGTINDEDWNRDSGGRDAEEPTPLCSEHVPELLEPAAENTRRTFRFIEVVRLFSCVLRSSRTQELADPDQAFGGQGSENKSPHKLEDGIDLGDEAFQIRAIAFGDQPGPGRTAREGVLLANRETGTSEEKWNRARLGGDTVVGDFTDLASNIGRLSVAQAEYYFEGDEPPSGYMWEMNWTARLKHFRLPTDKEQEETEERKQDPNVGSKLAQFGGLEPGASLADGCESQGATGCDQSAKSISLFDEIVRH